MYFLIRYISFNFCKKNVVKKKTKESLRRKVDEVMRRKLEELKRKRWMEVEEVNRSSWRKMVTGGGTWPVEEVKRRRHMASGRERTAAVHRLSRRLPAIDTSLSCFQATDEVPMVQEQHLLQQQAAPPGAGFRPWVPPPAHTLTREHTHLQNSLLQVNGRLTKLDLSVSSVKFTHSSALPPPRQSQPMGLQEPQGIKMHLLMHVCAALLCYCC